LKIIFLTYINRSGSTFLANELGKHPSIIACPEADILTNILLVRPNKDITEKKTKIINQLSEDIKLQTWRFSKSELQLPDDIKTCFDVFNYLLKTFKNKNKPNAKYIVYKAERLFQLLPELNSINRSYCNNLVFFLIRDIRAVYLSQKLTLMPGNNKPFSSNVIKTSIYWNRYIKSYFKSISTKPFIIKYEKFVLEHHDETHDIFHYLNLTPENLTSDKKWLFRFMNEEHKKIHQNILKDPLKNSCDKWKVQLNISDRKIIEYLSGRYLVKTGYSDFLNEKLNFYLKLKIHITVIVYYIIKLLNKIIHKTSYFKT
jgi:hypothetical protein